MNFLPNEMETFQFAYQRIKVFFFVYFSLTKFSTCEIYSDTSRAEFALFFEIRICLKLNILNAFFLSKPAA